MEKTMTLNLRVNPTVKQQAEDVLKQLGIPMATAIDMYLRPDWRHPLLAVFAEISCGSEC